MTVLSYDEIKRVANAREKAGVHDWSETYRITLLAVEDPIVSGGDEAEDPGANRDHDDINAWIDGLL